MCNTSIYLASGITGNYLISYFSSMCYLCRCIHSKPINILLYVASHIKLKTFSELSPKYICKINHLLCVRIFLLFVKKTNKNRDAKDLISLDLLIISYKYITATVVHCFYLEKLIQIANHLGYIKHK